MSPKKKKFTIEAIPDLIASGGVSDNLLQKINAATAKRVEAEESNSRVAAPSAMAYKKKTTNTKKKEEFQDAVDAARGGPKSRARLLFDAMTRLDDEFTLIAEGSIPTTKKDKPWIEGIRMKAPQYFSNFHKMGVDLIKISNIIISPNPKKELGYEGEPDCDPAHLPG